MQKCIAGSNALVTLSDGLILSVERSQHKVNDMKGGKSARRGDTKEQRTKEKRRKEKKLVKKRLEVSVPSRRQPTRW